MDFRREIPCAKPAVIAAENTQPVPWISRLVKRLDEKICISLPSKNKSSGVPLKCPPVIKTARTPIFKIARAALLVSEEFLIFIT